MVARRGDPGPRLIEDPFEGGIGVRTIAIPVLCIIGGQAMSGPRIAFPLISEGERQGCPTSST